MTGCFLAIDPGTVSLGFAAFEDDDLQGADVLVEPQHHRPLRRINAMVAALGEQMDWYEPQTIVIEQPVGYIAPSLATLVQAIKDDAWHRKLGFVSYYPETITSMVALRGTRAWGRKRQLRAGVEAVYPGRFNDKTPQDLIDAVAIGLCHLAKLREARILETAEE